jgi:hypothetical protein
MSGIWPPCTPTVEGAFAVAWVEGRAMPVEQAITYALESSELPESPEPLT